MAQINPPGIPVERGKIHEFAEAILDEHPHYHDEEAARAAGLPSVVAPPTFPIASALFAGAEQEMPPELLALDMRFALHGAQEFSFERPLFAGDQLTSELGEVREIWWESSVPTVPGRPRFSTSSQASFVPTPGKSG